VTLSKSIDHHFFLVLSFILESTRAAIAIIKAIDATPTDIHTAQ